ncbi:hypothetical protein CFC21_045505 [Triticum aestivum]|uniref:Uncharacterized protein n=3 Tax=Triticinae TaxID=1648030 RepID=A0A9R1FU37_WHEAT|nr:protein NEGATIVE REGULATOR OF RESISTANCE [Aegilops tauschii subsp. strangulata]XP_044352756.1 protein NEGATIVE REGULATOR OF RESISTANCE-like [Triticum aestivum]KAF7034501.1 hypothetical protein CFC21_045505 [Triticum aestivum]
MDAPSGTAKRKRSSAEAPAPVGVDDVSDTEVEEFYAILRRMRDASRRLVSGGVAAARARAPAPRTPAWCPSFSWEDFAPPAPPPPPPSQQPADERVAENASPPRRPVPRGLDLNAEPEPEVTPS